MIVLLIKILMKKILNKEIQEKFDRVLENEFFQRTTLLGIHKDDFSIYFDEVKFKIIMVHKVNKEYLFCV